MQFKSQLNHLRQVIVNSLLQQTYLGSGNPGVVVMLLGTLKAGRGV